ncbi:hypothetical protein AB1Y20_011538 [Prymnesium parvum]|uniref:GPI inositol-deacylase n=1 Tax=Prymnesium parvum TaxID=97485 RepID=A0AB34IHG6_PRYPA
MLALPLACQSFSDISRTSPATRQLVSGLTALVNTLGGAKASPAPRERKYASLPSSMVLEGLRADFVEREYLWSGKITPELYDEDCVFTDPTLSFRGLATFESNLKNLDPWIERFVPPSSRAVELRSLRLAEGGDAIEAEWRMTAALSLPWRPRFSLAGSTRFTLGGEGGRISAYDEAWAAPPAAALAQLLTPSRRVVLRAPPPLVILPGFGNDQRDYSTPFGRPEEEGFEAALRRRGVAEVRTVPIRRAAWLRVLAGVADPRFWRADALPEGPAFAWYLDEARRTVEACGGRVLLVGHSAGGWLARALCSDAAWARAHVLGVVTLGTPHASPPPADDPTRGALRNLNLRWASRPPGVFFVSVASDAVVGDEAAPRGSAAAVAFASYRMVCGDGRVAGDGVVPLNSAHLEGAEAQLTLRCFHSINEPGTTRPTDDWYGADAVVDLWLGEVAEQLRSQRLRSLLPSFGRPASPTLPSKRMGTTV